MKNITYTISALSIITMVTCLVSMFTEPAQVLIATCIFTLSGLVGCISIVAMPKN